MASKVEIEKIYGLSPMQEGMLFHSLYNQESNAYFQQSVLSIDGSIDRHAIEQSVQALVDQYDIFRTIFRYQKVKKPIQVVLKNRKAQVFFEDISMLEEKSQREALEALCNQDREKGFDLSKDLLMRVTLVKINEETTKLIWSFHHILMDGWCLGLIIHHFFDLYQSYKNGTIPDKMNIPPYHRYIEWLEKQNQHEALDYWQNILEGYDALATIPSNQTKTDEQGIYQKGEHAFLLDQQTTKQLVDLSHTYQVTVNSVFQAIWGILLQRYNNTNDVVFGAVVSGRPAQVKEVERIVGLFINTIPVRVSYEAKTRFSELIQAVQQAGLEAERYSYVPLYDIQAKHPLKQGLLDHIIGFQNYPVHQKVQLDSQDAIDFEVTDMEVFEQTNYDFNLQVIQEETITIKLLYNAHLLSRDLIHNIENHFNQLVQCILEAPERVVGEIPIVSAEEERQLLEELNGLNSEGDQKRHEAKSASTLTELFELQAEKTPHKTALVFKDQSMTYTELNQKANQLAHYLRLKGVKPEMTVGLMVERSFEMIIGILAILKAGGAYLPLAPTLPAERLEYMFKDSQTTLLLTQKHFSERLFFDGEIVYLDEPISYQESTDPLPVINQPADLAYMIYTSGSTGQPKGTCITHENVYQFVQDSSFIQITEEDRVLQILNFIFDGSVFDIFGSLLHGATLVLIEEAILLDMNQLADVIKREEISLFLITSALFNTLVEYNLNSLTGVRKILFGGEKASVRHVYRAFKHLGPGKLVNVYGPTEATVISTSYTIEQLNGQESSIPIGQPVSSACAYVLNQQLQLQPFGAVGELCIAGANVARGYHHRPELTAEKFITNPYNPSERLYRTGDLVRWNAAGQLEYIERVDQQVKIRGFRIELGEIEGKLMEYPGVEETVIVVRSEERRQDLLIAYYVSADNISVTGLREHLLISLPTYMVPSYFIRLEKIPLTASGKVDRRALPTIDQVGYASTDPYIAPRNELEEQLVKIWHEILGIEGIGVYDHFFENGGHSLNATRLSSEVHRQLGLELPIREIFQHPTIAQMSVYLQQAKQKSFISIQPAEEKEYYPVSSAQKRTYFIHQYQKVKTMYNVPIVMVLEGKVDITRLERTFHKLIERHEALRTSFAMVNGELVQEVHKNIEFKLERKAELGINLEHDKQKVQDLIKQFIRPFDLHVAPLLRAELVELSENKYLFLCDMHHIISDGVSMGIFIQEFITLWHGQELPVLKLQYKDFAVWEQSDRYQQYIQEQENYWMKQLEGVLPELNLPTDFERVEGQTLQGETLSFVIDKARSEKLKKMAEETKTTLYMLLMASYDVLLYKYTGKQDILVGSPISGRSHQEIQSVMGMFVNMLLIRNRVEGSDTFMQFLEQVKETVFQAFEHQDYPFEKLVEKITIDREGNRNPLIETVFAMQNLNPTVKNLSLSDDLQISIYDFDANIAKFDISIYAYDQEDHIQLDVQYCTELFRSETITRLLNSYLQLIDIILEEPYIKLNQIEIDRKLVKRNKKIEEDVFFQF